VESVDCQDSECAAHDSGERTHESGAQRRGLDIGSLDTSMRFTVSEVGGVEGPGGLQYIIFFHNHQS
jgi:hypothetical protein